MGLIISKLWQQLQQATLLKKVGIVMLGTLIAQGLVLGSAPILTRMYAVSQFGELGIFMLVGNFGIQLITWRFDYGIAGAKTLRDAARLLALCLVVGAGSLVVYGCTIYGITNMLFSITTFNLSGYLIYLLLYTYSFSIWNALVYYNIRRSKFKLNAYCNVFRAVLTVTGSLVLVKLNTVNGLIVAVALAQFFGMLVLAFCTIYTMPVRFFTQYFFGLKNIFAAIKQWHKLPKFAWPAAGLELLSGQLPQLFIGSYGTVIFGWFSQANRLLNAPLDLIGHSIRSVFWETAGATYRKLGHCIALFDKLLKRLVLLAFVPFVLLFILAPSIFSFALGAEWEPAGYYARYLLPFCFCRFISNPFSTLFYITSKQHVDLIIQGIVLVIIIIVFFNPFFKIDLVEMSLLAYSVIYSIKYIAELWAARQLAKGL